SLTSLNNTNEHYKEENQKLNLDFNIEILSFVNYILEQDESQKENIDSKIKLAYNISYFRI
ncbi:3918_t:CDS:1, partial [Scutellospora calospora]